MTNKINGATVFVVDTEDYSVSFEKELCAYLTGRVGEYNKGIEYAELFQRELNRKSFNNITCIPNENGESCPSSIWENPNYFNNGVGGNFPNGQEKEALLHYKTIVIKEAAQNIQYKRKILDMISHGIYLGELSIQQCKEAIQASEEQIRKAQKLTSVQKMPAYLSVGIFFNSPPPAIQLDILQMRAFKFNDARQIIDSLNNKPIIITGFRLINLQDKNNLCQSPHIYRF